jgi:hypothetical protein
MVIDMIRQSDDHTPSLPPPNKQKQQKKQQQKQQQNKIHTRKSSD